MNKVQMMGRLVADPEMLGKKDKQVARFRIAVDRRFKQEDGPEADFFNCVAFGKQADFAGVYLAKGKKMVFCGRFENNNFENDDGETVYRDQFVVEEMYFAESKQADDDEEKGKSSKKDKYKSKGKK